MIHDISLTEANDEIACYRCGRILDIEDSHCGNCGALLREDLVLL